MITRFIFSLILALLPVLASSAQELKCHSSIESESSLNSEAVKSNYEQQFAVAEQLRQLAAQADAEWLETEGLLVGSRKEAERNNWSEALELVQKACFQAEMALQQAEFELEAWKARVID